MAKIQIPESVLNEYKNGKSIRSLEKEYGYSVPTIIRRLKDAGIHQREDEKGKRYTINESYFERIDSEDKAYFLGLLYADGYIVGNTVGIDLQESDKQLLESFNKYLESNKSLKTYTSNIENAQKRVRLIITRKKLVEDLKKLGMTDRKTYTVCFPSTQQVPKQFQRDFIRGVFDGDGCITKGSMYYSSSITGNKCLLEGIEKVLIENTNIRKGYYTKRHKDKDDNILSMTFGSNSYSSQLYYFLYKNSTVHLNRKFYKMRQCALEWKGTIKAK